MSRLTQSLVLQQGQLRIQPDEMLAVKNKSSDVFHFIQQQHVGESNPFPYVVAILLLALVDDSPPPNTFFTP